MVEIFTRKDEAFYKNQKFPFAISAHWIGGKAFPMGKGGEGFISNNPSRDEQLVTFSCNKEAIKSSIDAAEQGLEQLKQFKLEQRMQWIEKIKNYVVSYREDFAAAMQLEVGKPAWDAYLEIKASIDYLNWVIDHSALIENALQNPGKLSHLDYQIHSRPSGVCVAYLPFTNPLSSFLSYLSAALFSGCSLVLFSSEHGALSTLLFSQLDRAIELPPGVLNTIFAGFEQFRLTLADQRVRAVIYTGSKEHCDSLRTDAHLVQNRQILLQSGGKNTALVHSTANLDLAVDSILTGAIRGSGQLCTSLNRVFVYRSLLSEFKEKMTKKMQELKIGPTDDLTNTEKDSPDLGPLYSKKAVEKFLRFQTMATREAEETWCWGRALEGKGSFVTPAIHLMAKVDSQSAYQRNIVFAPDIAIFTYDVLNDAIKEINDVTSCFYVSFFGDKQILEDRASQFVAPNLIVNRSYHEHYPLLPLAGRSLGVAHRYHGIALAFYLSHPQAIL